MIQNFADPETKRLFVEEKSTRYSSIKRVALRKLIQMNRAATLQDLRVPPGNRLESLKGELKGFHSIRINEQWRIVFKWTELGPDRVRILDYH
jgi:proteic killer suppression protein